MMHTLRTLDQMVEKFCKYASIMLLLALFVLLGVAMFLRIVPLFTISGYDEVVEFLFIWIVVLTTIALWREGALYRVAMLENLLPQVGQVALSIVINLTMLVFALMLVFYGWQFAVNAGETTPFLRINKIYWHAAVPVGGMVMSVYSVVWIWRVVRDRQTLQQDSSLIS